MIDQENEGELNSSNLGTLNYWENCYEKEIQNFEGFGDEGEIWFGVQIVKRIINWIKAQSFDKMSTYFVDIGCGNGFTCCKLSEEGFINVFGIDYSEKAIQLSRSISKAKNLLINYQVVDVLDEKIHETFIKFDIAIDKGTYDAIALCPDDSKTKRHLYKKFLCNILKLGKFFIITSCNWTRDELVGFFTKEQQFEFFEELKPKNDQPNFSFGGKIGATTTTIIFKRV